MSAAVQGEQVARLLDQSPDDEVQASAVELAAENAALKEAVAKLVDERDQFKAGLQQSQVLLSQQQATMQQLTRYAEELAHWKNDVRAALLDVKGML